MVKMLMLSSVVMVALAACGKPADPTKTAEQQKAEKDAATKATRENPVYGDQLKAMDKAKAVTEEANKKREEAVPLAEKIAAKIKEMDGVEVAKGALDITLYRDDLTTVADRPVINKTELPANITGKTIILVDDVLYTGRTIRAALNEIFDYGRPASVTLAVLVSRNGRELPIEAGACGANLTLPPNQQLKLRGPAPLRLELVERTSRPA